MRTPNSSLNRVLWVPLDLVRRPSQPGLYATAQARRRTVLLMAIEQRDQTIAAFVLADLGGLLGAW